MECKHINQNEVENTKREGKPVIPQIQKTRKQKNNNMNNTTQKNTKKKSERVNRFYYIRNIEHAIIYYVILNDLQ